MLPFVQLAICLVYEIDCFLVGGMGLQCGHVLPYHQLRSLVYVKTYDFCTVK